MPHLNRLPRFAGLVVLLLAAAAAGARAAETAPESARLVVDTGHRERVDHVAALPDGSLYFSVEGRILRIWEGRTGRLLRAHELGATVDQILPVPERGTLLAATRENTRVISLETLEMIASDWRGRITGMVYEAEMGVVYGFRHNVGLVEVDPLTGVSAEIASFRQRGRLIPHGFEVLLLGAADRFYRIDLTARTIEAGPELAETSRFADIDAGRFAGFQLERISATDYVFRVRIYDKADLSVRGQAEVPLPELAQGWRGAVPTRPFVAGSDRLFVLATGELFEFALDGDRPALAARHPLTESFLGAPAFSALTPLATGPADRPRFLVGASASGPAVGGEGQGVYLGEWSPLAAEAAGLRRLGRAQAPIRRVVAHPRRDAFFVLGAGGRVQRVQIRPDGLAVSTLEARSDTLAITPDGRALLLVIDGVLTLQPIDARPAEAWPEPRRIDIAHVYDEDTDWAFSADGRRLAGNDHGRIDVWDLGEKIRKIYEASFYGWAVRGDPAGWVALSPHGRYVAFVNHPKHPENPRRDVYGLGCVEVDTGEVLWRTTPRRAVRGLGFVGPSTLGQVVPEKGDYYGADAVSGKILVGGGLRDHPRRNHLPHDATSVWAYSRDRSRIVLTRDREWMVLDAATGDLERALPALSSRATGLEFFSNPRYLLVTTADGRIRLWDLEEEKELARLALFAADDAWVLVTPDFRFQGSPGAADRMYFVRGRRTIGLDALHERFYTPRLIGRLLAGAELSPLVPPDALALPPEVTVRLTDGAGEPIEGRPADGAVRVTVEARSEASRVTEIRLYHNRKLVSARQRGLVVEDDEPDEAAEVFTRSRTWTLPVLEGENVFRAIALNAERTESAPAVATLEAGGEPAGPGGLRLFLVAVGIDDYVNPKYRLNYAVDDARALTERVTAGTEAIYGEVRRTLLLDREATRERIIGALEAVAGEAGPHDVLIFYYAGHGAMSSAEEPEFHLVPPAVTQLYGDDAALAERGLAASELRELAAQIPARKQLFLLDACQAAGALESVALRGAAEEKAIARLARATGTYWLTATGSEQFAAEVESLGHGVFTWSILEALRGAADDGDGTITVLELDSFLQRRVPELTREHRGSTQFPASYGYGQDFPLTLAGGEE